MCGRSGAPEREPQTKGWEDKLEGTAAPSLLKHVSLDLSFHPWVIGHNEMSYSEIIPGKSGEGGNETLEHYPNIAPCRTGIWKDAVESAPEHSINMATFGEVGGESYQFDAEQANFGRIRLVGACEVRREALDGKVPTILGHSRSGHPHADGAGILFRVLFDYFVANSTAPPPPLKLTLS